MNLRVAEIIFVSRTFDEGNIEATSGYFSVIELAASRFF